MKTKLLYCLAISAVGAVFAKKIYDGINAFIDETQEDCHHDCMGCCDCCDVNEAVADVDKKMPDWEALEKAAAELNKQKVTRTAIDRIKEMPEDELVKMVELYEMVKKQNAIEDIYKSAGSSD